MNKERDRNNYVRTIYFEVYNIAASIYKHKKTHINGSYWYLLIPNTVCILSVMHQTTYHGRS